jgi:hypothetical protein
LPYIVEKDYVKGSYLTRNAAIGDTTLYVADTSNFVAGAATIYDDSVPIDPATGLRVNTETITILSKTATTLVLAAGLTNSYTGQFSGNLYQQNIAIAEHLEFDIRIKSKWCKIAQIKIVQQIAGTMKITFEVWEETPIYEGNRIEMHKNVIRRNITLTALQGGWYGESLVNNLMLYQDGEDPGEEREYNLHCALINEEGGTVSDFHVLFKLVEIGELI